MDPITLAIVTALSAGVTGGVKKVGEIAFSDAYHALKALIKKKCGGKSDLSDAVTSLEKKPESNARQAMLQEEVTAVRADKDLDLLQAAQVLMVELEKRAEGSVTISQQAGDNAIQIGQISGNATIGR